MANTIELDVKVTQQHIDEGKAHKCRECPGALAINEALNELFGPGRYAASVGNFVVIRQFVEPHEDGTPRIGPEAFVGPSPMELNYLVAKVDVPTTYGTPEPTSFHLSLGPVLHHSAGTGPRGASVGSGPGPQELTITGGRLGGDNQRWCMP